MKFIREEARKIKIEKLLKDAPPELINFILLEALKKRSITAEKKTKITFRLENIKY